MPARPSGGACGKCKTRHLKCDEGRPGCMRCLASNTACPGYFQETKFLDEGVGLRRKFNYDEAYYSSTSRKKPKELVTSSDKGYEHDLDALPPLTFQSPGDSEPAFNQRSSHDESEIANTSPFAASDSHTETEPAEENDILESNNFRDQNVVLDAYPDSNGSSSLKQRPTYGTDSSLSNSMFSVFQNSTNRLSTLSLPSGPVLLENEEESEFEILFLIRHFTEVVGSWMDLYDLGKYFAAQVPVRALKSPLLRYSAAAIAAKQLGRVKGNKPIFGGICKRQASTETYPNCDRTNWFYIATKYYNKAIKFLREGLVDVSSQNYSHSSLLNTDENASQQVRLMQEQRHSAQADDLLASTSILSVYEFMDDSSVEWSRHLSGVKSLLDEANVNVMPQCVKPSRAQVATFWNFARCDYIAAYISHTSTRLDTEDISLWRSAGLVIDERGIIVPGKAGYSTYIRGENDMREDMTANALVFILSKIMNFLSPTSSRAQNNPNRWKTLHREVEAWFESLPESFTECWRLEVDLKSADASRANFAEVFYSIPLCSVTMQHYHFAQIILLLHMPRETSASVMDQLRSYRAVPEKIAYHSREICAIALGRPPAHVRIHMLQPIFLAGQCLEGLQERKVILELLRNIETDLGWATEYRVQELLKEWGWESNRAE